MASRLTIKEADLPFNQNVELQKIQILDGYCQTKLNAQYSLFTGGFVGILLFYVSLSYQGLFNVFNNFVVSNTILVTLILLTAYAFKRSLDNIVKRHDKALNKLNDFLVDVEHQQKLVSIPELKKQLAM